MFWHACQATPAFRWGRSAYLEDTTLPARLRSKDTYLREVDRRGGKTDGREDILEFVDD